MKKLIIASLATALSFGFTANANAADNAMSTSDILTYCKADGASFVTCEIYGQAVYDTYVVYSQHKKGPKFICVKQPAPTRAEVIKEYVAWAEANPAYGNQPAADTILRFLGGRFPCAKPTK